MSLITLNSSGSPNPAYYTSHLSQPLTIKPYSQVCLMKFLHFKNAGVFNVNGTNNVFYYVVGSLASVPSQSNSAPIRVTLNTGSYTGIQLAAHITAQMMGGLQQQNFSLTCTFTAGDPTTSPETFDKFEIAYVSVVTPDLTNPVYDIVPGKGGGTIADGVLSPTTTGGMTDGTEFSAVSKNGVVTHLGSFETAGFRLNADTYGTGAAADWTATMRTAKVGLVRDILSNIEDENVNKRYSEGLLDVGIGMGGATPDVIQVSSLVGSSVSWGNPNYVTSRIQRSIRLDSIVKALLVDATVVGQWSDFQFKFRITASQSSIGRAICQLLYSLDGGVTFTLVPAGRGGGSGGGPDFIQDFTNTADSIAYPGSFWVSDKVTFQNTGIAAPQSLLKPKRAPFHPISYFRGAQPDTLGAATAIISKGRLNPKDNAALTTYSIQGSSRTWSSDAIATAIAASLSSADYEGPGAEVQAAGEELATKVILFAGQITDGDMADPDLIGPPVNISANRFEGTVNGLLGLSSTIYVTPSATTGGSIAVSDMEVQRVSRDNVLMVSVPELSGLKSYQGIDKGIGKHLSGEAKVLSVLPREEFAGVSDNGHLVYVAPFENWLDVNNAGPIVLNQLTIEVRILSGELADDLVAITTAQIKFREDPTRAASQYQRDLISALRGDTQQTGQILSKNLQIVSS